MQSDIPFRACKNYKFLQKSSANNCDCPKSDVRHKQLVL